ncbi:MAG: lipopolysaccharide heptosyltransferase II [bacterium JZ-2024 1]
MGGNADGPGSVGHPFLQGISGMKVLIVELSYLGDLLLTTPLIRALKKKFPLATLDVLASAYSAEILTGNPYIRTVWRWKKQNVLKDFREWVSVLKREKYDEVFVLHRSVRAALWAYLTGIPSRYGFTTFPGRWLLTVHIPFRSDIHRAENHLRLFSKVYQTEFSDTKLDIFVPPQVREEIQKLLPENEYFVLHPAGSWESKNWMPEGYAEVADELKDTYGWEAVFTGTAGDAKIVESILRRMRHGGYNLAGKTTVMQLAGVLAGAKLVLTCDSGPMHIASALNVPTFAFFGPTSPIRSGPLGSHSHVFFAGVPCSPCYRKKCPPKFAHQCMTKITPDLVSDKIQNFLKKEK